MKFPESPSQDGQLAVAEWREQAEALTQLYGLLPRGVRSMPPLPPFFTGYQSGVLYDWDQYFEGILLGATGWPVEYLRNGVRIFLSRQLEDGFISRSVNFGFPGGVPPKHRTMIKPFLGQITLLCYHLAEDSSWVVQEGLWGKLLRYLACWRTGQNLDPETGLSVWHSTGQTGMDNLYERAGAFGGPNCFCAGADLNSYLVREMKALSILGEILGHEKEAQRLAADAEELSNVVRARLWCEEDDFFHDWHVLERRFVGVKTAAGFLPLWAEIPTPSQAARLVHNLRDPDTFWRPWPIPALAASEATYVEGFLPEEGTNCCSWRGNTWVPLNYMIFQGLRMYGFTETARALADKTWQLFRRAPFSEYYTSESGNGTGSRPFWGWTGLALFMQPELDLDVDPTRLVMHNNACRALHDYESKVVCNSRSTIFAMHVT